jgi:hypothetical protein
VEAFYSTIFVAVLALFGLLVAALIYVAQTVQDRYSTKLAQRLLKGRLSLSFWSFGLLTLLLASLELFGLAYPTVSIRVSARPLSAIIGNPSYGVVTLSGVFLTLLFFMFTLRSYARLLSPLTVLKEIASTLSPYAVRNIAILRLHREAPAYTLEDAELRKLMRQLQRVPDSSPNVELDATVPARTGLFGWLKTWLPQLINWRRKNRPSKIEKIKKALRAKDRAEILEDPLADLFEYGLSAIDKNNALAWRAFLQRLADVFTQSAQLGLLNEDSEVPFLGETLLIQGLERLSAEIRVARRYSLTLQLNDAIKEICEAFMSVNSWRRVYPFLTFLQDIGAQSLDRKDWIVFRSSVRVVTNIGIVSMKNEAESEVFDDVCRKVGWLGEKLILRGVEDSPIMPRGNETEELEEITEGITNLSNAVCEGKTDKYPLILRDAVEVICDQALKKNEPKKFEDTLISLVGIHERLAQHLIARESKNSEAYLWLVLNYFKQVLSSYDLAGYRELRMDIFSWVGTLARETVAHNQQVLQFWNRRISGARDLQGLIISFMVEMGTPDDWDAAMLDVEIKSHQHTRQAWQFVKRAGTELHTNFGFMFDPDTGEDYAENDPRRR